MSPYKKYPRTPHLPWSRAVTEDDKVLKDTSHFDGKRVIVSIKYDGENTTLYNDHFHARSLDSRDHPSRAWVKAFWGSIRHDIPSGWRICGENLYAKHSIEYTDLESYFYGFSIWDHPENTCLSWADTLVWFEGLGITPVEVLYDGVYDEEVIKTIWETKDPERCEGYVIRLYDSFRYEDFRKSVAKFVRKNHVQTDEHWMFKAVEKNLLKE